MTLWMQESKLSHTKKFEIHDAMINKMLRLVFRCKEIASHLYPSLELCILQWKGTLFRNIQNTGRWNYSDLGSRQVPIYWLGSYFLIFLPSCVSCPDYSKSHWRIKNINFGTNIIYIPESFNTNISHQFLLQNNLCEFTKGFFFYFNPSFKGSFWRNIVYKNKFESKISILIHASCTNCYWLYCSFI